MRYKVQAGVTLIELLVVVALIAIVAGIGVPSYQSFMRESRLSSASEEMIISLMLANTEASMQGKDITVTASGGNWLNGWTVEDASGTLRVVQPFSGIDSASGTSPITFKPLLKAGTSVSVEFCSVGAKKRTINVETVGTIKRAEGAKATSCP